MTVLLALVLVAALGTWIPLAQLLPGTPGRSQVFYVAVGNAVFAGIALLAGGADLVFGWRGFWLPLAGGVVWAAGSYCLFKAPETIGLARAAGTWTPLNIVVAFAWGALLFGELDGFSKARFAVLGVAFLVLVAGVLLIAGSRDGPSGQPSSSSPRPGAAAESGRRAATAQAGLLWAGGRGSCGGVTSCRRSGPRFPPR
jgi:glucose uptake protein GlcU